MGVGPSWFAADQVFEGNGGWYIGSREGFSIGPYETMAAAQATVEELRRQLADSGSVRVGELLRVVRRLVDERQGDVVRRSSYGRMSPARAGELARLGHRSPGLFVLYGRWYFVTREGIDVGPYPSSSAAEDGRRRLVATLAGCDTLRQRRRVIAEFMTGPPVSGV